MPPYHVKGVTYSKFKHSIQLQKDKLNHTILTVGVNQINYPDELGMPTVDMLFLVKGAKNMTVNINLFRLNTPMK